MKMVFYKHLGLCITAAVAFGMTLVQDAVAQFRFQNQNTFSNSGSSTYGNTRQYNTHGQVGTALIEADPDTRSIIIITDDETNAHVGDIIRNLDRPVSQVLIKVVFLEVHYRDDVDFGIEGYIDLNNDDTDSNLFKTVFGLATETRGGFYQLLEDDVQVTLRAIAEVGKVEVLSRPSILTRNNQEAVITVGQEVPFVRNSRITEQGQTINTVEYEDIGIILRVTPFITQDGLVEMILSPEISTITDETVPISDTINSPVFAKRAADTVVVTPNGKTVVIGGMMEDNNVEAVRKVPFLGDIPLLGLAFRRTVTNKSKTELMIFLTPYVVEAPHHLIEMSQHEESQSELAPKAFSEQQINKYLDGREKHGSDVPEQIEQQTETKPAAVKPAPKKQSSSSAASKNRARRIKGK